MGYLTGVVGLKTIFQVFSYPGIMACVILFTNKYVNIVEALHMAFPLGFAEVKVALEKVWVIQGSCGPASPSGYAVAAFAFRFAPSNAKTSWLAKVKFATLKV